MFNHVYSMWSQRYHSGSSELRSLSALPPVTSVCPHSPAAEMVRSPFETRSDSFYFVDNRLVMHNRAEYAYDA